DTGSACLTIRHVTLRRGNDGHAKSVHYRRNLLRTAIDSQTRAAYALDLFNHRAACIVLEADVQLRLALDILHSEIIDITLILKNARDRALELGCRHGNSCLVDALRIADARQHVGNRITHTHSSIPPLPTRLDDAG